MAAHLFVLQLPRAWPKEYAERSIGAHMAMKICSMPALLMPMRTMKAEHTAIPIQKGANSGSRNPFLPHWVAQMVHKLNRIASPLLTAVLIEKG